MKDQKQIKLPAIIQTMTALPTSIHKGGVGKNLPVYCHLNMTLWFVSLEEMEVFAGIVLSHESDGPSDKTAFNPVSLTFKGRK